MQYSRPWLIENVTLIHGMGISSLMHLKSLKPRFPEPSEPAEELQCLKKISPPLFNENAKGLSKTKCVSLQN
jgi:hypothetical protein